ncbi:MAG: hypothetical protein IJ099_03140 [Alphaproteobacteria bacterium]|nr:hypothetical protein [Alphaproteobacteria bacterium]
MILRLFSELDLSQKGMQFVYNFDWLTSANITLSFGVDAFSLLLLAGIYISLLTAVVSLPLQQHENKSLLAWNMYFLWNVSGLLFANDIISFYTFFAAILLPLFMLIGQFGDLKKKIGLYMFFIFNFAGIIVLLCAVVLVFKYYHGNIMLHEIALMNMPQKAAKAVWGGVCLALLARIPIWPFHYWISSIVSIIKNPLVYIITMLVPLTGLYGFMRFWQLTIAESVMPYINFMAIICLITMIFIVLIGIAHKEFLYKLFAYMTVYYLLFLLAEILLSSILQADTLQMNIAYALFTFLPVTSILIILDLQMEKECEDKNCDYRGILAYMPKRAKIFVFYVIMALGMPVSALFWNNFIIVSDLFKFSFNIGICVMFALSLLTISMLYELYVMRDLKKHISPNENIADISNLHLAYLAFIGAILFLSFFNPLWFKF